MSTLKELVDETSSIKTDIVTCHSNLKEKLVEKGAEVSDSDKMLTLINKIDDLSSVNVEYGAELPATAKENTIFIVTDVEPNKIYLEENTPESLVNNDFYIKIRSTDAGNDKYFYVDSNKTNLSIYIVSCFRQKENTLELNLAYISQNGNWVKFSSTESILYSPTESMYELGSKDGYSIYNEKFITAKVTIENTLKLSIRYDQTEYTGEYGFIISSQEIDFRSLNTLLINVEGGDRDFYNIIVGISNENNQNTTLKLSQEINYYGDALEVEFNTSNIDSGFLYFKLEPSGTFDLNINISQIKAY